MSFKTHASILAGAAALTLTSVGFAGTPTDNDKLIQGLQARIAELERKQGDNWLTEQRAEEIRGIVHDVLADADTRASLLSSGMTAGYDDGFVIGDAAGNFSLRINGQIQARYMYSNQKEAVTSLRIGRFHVADLGGGFLAFAMQQFDILGAFIPLPDDLILLGDRHRGGFENSRTKLWFSGHVLNPSWQYHVEVDFGPYGTGMLRDAWIAHTYGDTGLTFTVGQFKLPFLREQLVDSRYQQAVERSLVHSYFTAGRSGGVQVEWQQEMFRILGAYSNGANRENQASMSWGTEWALTARAEVKLCGNWNQFHEFRSPPGEELAVLIGGAFHWEKSEYGTFLPFETEYFGLTLDAHAKFGGWNLYGAYIFSHYDIDDAGGIFGPIAKFSNHAFVVQGGVHLAPEWELFGRYEHVLWDSDIRDNLLVKDLSILTLGVNYYMFGGNNHNAKWTTDFGYAFNRIAVGDIRTGWRPDGDNSSNDGQFVIRSQIQLAF